MPWRTSGRCTISAINDTALVYEFDAPFRWFIDGGYKGDKCSVEFYCSGGQVPRYSIQRFEIEESRWNLYCHRDHLGLYNNQSIYFYSFCF